MISRRTVAKGTVALALGLAGREALAADNEVQKEHTFVLIHGNWHGGWCWNKVKEYLESRGHTVFTPTLTGCGERSHLASPEVNMDTHIADVTNVLIWEELDNVVLVGHGHGGGVVTGVCDNLKDRIAHAMYINGPTPSSGETMMVPAAMDRGELVDGYLVPPLPNMFGVPDSMPEEQAWLKRRLTPHPLGTWTQVLKFKNGGSSGVPRSFVYCDDGDPRTEELAAHLQLYRDSVYSKWQYYELEVGHDLMIHKPIETGQFLERIADQA